MKPQLPNAVTQLLHQLRDELPPILGDNLFGIYTYGSVTQGAFDPARGDVDCVVLVRSGLTQTQVDHLRDWLTDAAAANAWVARLQISFLIKDELFMMDGQGWLYQFGVFERSGSDGNPLIWLNILESGTVLWGPPPQTFVPLISERMVSQALDRELGYLRDEIIENASRKWRDVAFYRAYAVLTVCRILFTHRTRRIESKPKAAAWTLANFPGDWSVLVRQALAFDRGEREEALPLPPIADFICFAETQLARP